MGSESFAFGWSHGARHTDCYRWMNFTVALMLINGKDGTHRSYILRSYTAGEEVILSIGFMLTLSIETRLHGNGNMSI